jgi:tRNA pseudouridine65 synthase
VLTILYQDDHYVAVNKPAGLLVHRTSIDNHETCFALQMVRDQVGGRVFPVHRLDKPTSGVVVFARDSRAVEALAARFRAHEVAKRYLAIVRGYLQDEDRIEHALTNERGRKQEATTNYRCIARAELPHAVGRYATARYSLAVISPETGRTHQIRRHMKHIFHPIIGDRKYGDDRHTRFFEEHFGSTRLLLHAAEIRFVHPFSNAETSVRAPLDESFSSVAESVGWGEAFEGW